MTDRELMQQALDALERFATDETPDGWFAISAIQALRARLAQPEHVHANDTSQERVRKTAKNEHEPVAWHEPGAYGNVTVYEGWAKENGWLPLYTAPPKREFIGLTDEERYLNDARTAEEIEYAHAIEAKLKEKNT